MPTLLEDYYDRPFVHRLATAVAASAPGFDTRGFERAVLAGPWPALALKARMRRVSTRLGERLPGAYAQQIAVLEGIAPAFTGLTALVFPDFVEVHGQHDPARSLTALARFTRYSTSEFAVRPFIVRDPDGTQCRQQPERHRQGPPRCAARRRPSLARRRRGHRSPPEARLPHAPEAR